MTSPPIIKTDRLILRRPDVRDLGGYVAFFTSERSRYVDGPLSATRAWREFATELGHWDLRGFGMFSVALQTSPEVPLGLVGPWYPADWPETEIGWLMWPDGEARGLAFEAADATLTHAFGTLGWSTAVSYVDPGNARSIALAERLGALRDDDAPRPHPNDLVFRHPARSAA